MELIVQTFTVQKKFALKISRGTTDRTTNLWLKIREDNIEGWGEASPFSISKAESQDTARFKQEITQISPKLARFNPLQRQEIAEILAQETVSSAVKAAIDMALYDWLGKKVGLPLWQLWGLNRDRIVPISVTIGISSPEAAVKRGQEWQKTLDFQLLKLKLGANEGIERDRAMLTAVKAAFPQTRLTVDANGGWSFADAVTMSHWLASMGVEYIEQPLSVADDDKLADLSERSPLPIFVDESCFTSQDILRLASSVAGVNLKVMKTGGLTEAKRAIEIAKACGLKVMFGCYSDSSLANTAMSHLAPLADYLDLDSHLNLVNDPFSGAIVSSGRLLPSDRPGLGVKYCVKILD
jgi:L-Ala-D/L-Glu epimerase